MFAAITKQLFLAGLGIGSIMALVLFWIVNMMWDKLKELKQYYRDEGEMAGRIAMEPALQVEKNGRATAEAKTQEVQGLLEQYRDLNWRLKSRLDRAEENLGQTEQEVDFLKETLAEARAEIEKKALMLRQAISSHELDSVADHYG